jgi:hypothetical protein
MPDPRTPPRQPPEAPAPDPADLGTAFGMEISIAGADAIEAKPEDDPLHWIRHWLAQHPVK